MDNFTLCNLKTNIVAESALGVLMKRQMYKRSYIIVLCAGIGVSLVLSCMLMKEWLQYCVLC